MLQAGRSRVRFPLWSLDFFQLTLYLQPHYGSGVDSASNRNEYQESSWGVKGFRRVRQKASPLSVSRLSKENVGASTSHNPMSLYVRSIKSTLCTFFYFYLIFLCLALILFRIDKWLSLFRMISLTDTK
jgi:hypothetical protein